MPWSPPLPSVDGRLRRGGGYAAEWAEQAKQMAQCQARPQGGAKVRGPAPPPEPKPTDQYNFTGPASRIMKAGSGGHFQQAYNARRLHRLGAGLKLAAAR